MSDERGSLDLKQVTLSKEGNILIHRIDTLFGDEKIDFIKGDLEGFEMEVLLGARETIRKNRPKIAITKMIGVKCGTTCCPWFQNIAGS